MASYFRVAASPGAALAIMKMNREIDVRQILPAIRTPTLVLHRAAESVIEIGHARYLARHIPLRRVRKGECPYCGYPIRVGDHCEGCGRTVVGECTTCHLPRRIGTFHCAACGAD